PPPPAPYPLSLHDALPIFVAEPQSSYHATVVGAADDALRAILPPGWIVRAQMPVALDDESAPEPDLVVVPGIRADYRDSHPARPDRKSTRLNSSHVSISYA